MIVSVQVMNPYETGTAEADRIGEASFFLDSTVSDADRTLEMAMRRAVTGVTNEIVLEGEPSDNSEQDVSEALVNGSMEGQNLEGTENASLNDWSERVADIAESSGYNVEIGLEDYSFEENGLTIDSSFTVNTVLEDPVTRVEFNRTTSTSTSSTVEGIEDPMVTLRSEGRYIKQYNECGFSEPAEKLYAGSQSSTGYEKGLAEVMPENPGDVEDRNEKILVVEDIDSYDTSEVEDYQGFVSAEQSDNPESFESYVFGTGSIQEISQGTSLILNEDQVWNSNFEKMFQEDCYVETDTGPGVLDRMENRLTGTESNGVASMVDVSDLPEELQRQESAVDYVYFNQSGSYGDINEIKGVSDRYSWFYIDDYHVEYWELEDLVG